MSIIASARRRARHARIGSAGGLVTLVLLALTAAPASAQTWSVSLTGGAAVTVGQTVTLKAVVAGSPLPAGARIWFGRQQLDQQGNRIGSPQWVTCPVGSRACNWNQTAATPQAWVYQAAVGGLPSVVPRSNVVTVKWTSQGGPAQLSVNPMVVRRGTIVNVTWSGVPDPSTTTIYGAGGGIFFARGIGGMAAGTTTLEIPARGQPGIYDISLYSKGSFLRTVRIRVTL